MTKNNQETALINSIKNEADNEARQILENADRVIKERKKSTDQQITKLQKDNKEKEQRQIETIANESKRKIESLKKKQMLSLKEQIVKHVTTRIKEKFVKSLSETELKEMMLEWTVEAALGLEEKDAVLRVTESCKPFADSAFCKEAMHRYKALTGKDITIILSSDVIKKGHGIILEAKNGRTAFNNLLGNRLYRYKDTIEALVLEDIFNE